MVAPLLFLISIASFTHLLYLFCSVPVTFALSHPMTWFFSTTWFVTADLWTDDSNCFLLAFVTTDLLATPDFPQAEVQPLLAVAVSSRVEKEGRCPCNVHSKSITFWIRNQGIFLIYFKDDPDESIQSYSTILWTKHGETST